MSGASATERARRAYDEWFPADDLPARHDLPWFVAPLPDWLEDLGLRLAWLVVAVNLAGTAFGFWFYGPQLGYTEPVMWPFVPDSPLATLFIALSLASWKLGYADRVPWLHALAFFGCIKLGAWTPVVLTVFPVEYPGGSLAALGTLGFVWEYGLYAFLVVSHLAMVVEAFLVHRYAEFGVGAVAVATAWYTWNDIVDYLVPIVGEPHHTALSAEPFAPGPQVFDHSVPAHDIAAAVAIVLTVTCVFLALSTRVAELRAERGG
jgi:uncharacterized membrane protein YpjA